ncbi:MAG: hypothetical protein U0269_23055 [Polyangiales bacterium]
MFAEQLFIARLVTAVAVAMIALVIEARSDRIPNALTFPALLAALALRTGLGAREQLFGWLAATFVGLVPGYFAFRRGGAGAGAIKLVAATCAFMSLAGAAAETACVFVIGLVLAARDVDERRRSTPAIALATVVGALVSWFAR